MAVFSAFRAALGSLGRNPILVVVAGLYGLLQVPQMVAQGVHPLLSSVVSLGMLPVVLLVAPFVFAGLIAMAAEAIDGTTSFDTLIERGKRHYVSVLGAYLVLVAVNFVLLFVVFAVVFVGGVVFIRQSTPDPALLAGVGVVLAVLVLAYLVVAFFLQFFAHAIVLDGQGAVDGLKQSVHVVRTNLLATFGYSLVVGVLGGVAGVVAAVLSMVASAGASTQFGGSVGPGFGPGAGMDPGSGMQPGATTPSFLPEVGIAGALLALLLYLLLTGLFGGFFAAYSTAFYREMRGTA
jgi:hypothetical protein